MFFQDPPNGPSGSKPLNHRGPSASPSLGHPEESNDATGRMATFSTFPGLPIDASSSSSSSSSPLHGGGPSQSTSSESNRIPTNPEDNDQDTLMEAESEMEMDDITPTEQGMDSRISPSLMMGGVGGGAMTSGIGPTGFDLGIGSTSHRYQELEQHHHHQHQYQSQTQQSSPHPRSASRNFSDHRQRKNSIPDTPTGPDGSEGSEGEGSGDGRARVRWSSQESEGFDASEGGAGAQRTLGMDPDTDTDMDGDSQSSTSASGTDTGRTIKPSTSSTGLPTHLPSISSPPPISNQGTFVHPSSSGYGSQGLASGSASSPSPSPASSGIRSSGLVASSNPKTKMTSSSSSPNLPSSSSFLTSSSNSSSLMEPPSNQFNLISPHSPWAHLARTSGAPTPRTERPGSSADPFGAFFAGAIGSAGGGGGGDGGSSGSGGSGSGSRSANLGGPFQMMNIGGFGGVPSNWVASGSGSGSGSGSSTPSMARMTMPDPFASFSMGSTGSGNGGIPGSGLGSGTSSMDALLARRRGSKTGLSGLGKVQTPQRTGRSPPEPRDGDGIPDAGNQKQATDGTFPTSSSSSDLSSSASTQSTATERVVPAGAVYGQGRRIGTGSLDALAVPGIGGSGMKLNFPGGLAARRSAANQASGSAAGPGSGSVPSLSASGINQPLVVCVPNALTPSSLPSLLAHPESTLVLDLRPPSSFASGHIPSSLSLPISSTLIKRPGFTLDKLAEMLEPYPAKMLKRFRERKDIVIIDQDSSTAPANSNLTGLASKFANAPKESEGAGGHEFAGKIWFLRGGIASCTDLPGVELVAGEDMWPADDIVGGETVPKKAAAETSRALQPSMIGKMLGGLDKLAFQQGSIKGLAGKRNTPAKAMTLPTPGPGGNKFTLRLPGQGGQPMVSSGRPTSPRAEHGPEDSLQPANPFFDNIRQNLELSHGGITERITLSLTSDVRARAFELPAFLRDLVEGSPNEVAETLAKEFENVERNEQRRLQGIMEWHSKGCSCLDDLSTPRREAPGADTEADARTRKDDKLKVFPRDLKRMTSKGEVSQTSAWQQELAPGDHEHYFPFSITAGVERGSKNRYKNIWPYDFSRVRLAQVNREDGSDYINANFIQPHGTSRRYIATQGPLDATFQDFWTLVWEQDVNVIVMLTKQFEGGSIKCGSYWTDGKYGTIELTLLSTEGESLSEQPPMAGFNFPSAAPPAGEESVQTIRRHFLLTNLQYPEARKRHLTQVQCLAWPDFDVPSDPRTLLSLLKDVDHASEDMAIQNRQTGSAKPPVLVHCSAGVGRTGGYIVVDAVLDGLRREHSMRSRVIRGSISSSRFGSRKHSITSGSDASLSDAPMESPASDLMEGIPGVVSMSPDLLSGAAEVSKELGITPARANVSDAPSEAKTPLDDSDTRSLEHARLPGSLTAVADPVMHVLEGMRVQRMSLCQSLRQYLFVYRAIITGYLDMLDDEREAAHEDATRHASQYGSAGSAGTTDDEGHHKRRRASPSDLSEARLQKRPSIKLRGSAARVARTQAQSADRSAGSPTMPSPTLIESAEYPPHHPSGDYHRTKSSLSNLAVAMDTSDE